MPCAMVRVPFGRTWCFTAVADRMSSCRASTKRTRATAHQRIELDASNLRKDQLRLCSAKEPGHIARSRAERPGAGFPARLMAALARHLAPSAARTFRNVRTVTGLGRPLDRACGGCPAADGSRPLRGRSRCHDRDLACGDPAFVPCARAHRGNPHRSGTGSARRHGRGHGRGCCAPRSQPSCGRQNPNDMLAHGARARALRVESRSPSWLPRTAIWPRTRSISSRSTTTCCLR